MPDIRSAAEAVFRAILREQDALAKTDDTRKAAVARIQKALDANRAELSDATPQ